MAYIVVIENDGMKPPSKYYADRERMALVVRGDRSSDPTAPAARRFSRKDGRGAIIQEGCIITPSWSQARAIANLARDNGIESVWIGTTELSSYNPDPADQEAYNRIQEVFGRRGRPPVAQNWVSTCFEELNSFAIESPAVALCPSCGGTNMRSRLGSLSVVRDETNSADDIFDFWVRSRFISGYFEIPKLSKAKNAQKATRAPFMLSHEEQFVERLRSSRDFQDILNPNVQIDNDTRLAILDSAVGACLYTVADVQIQARDRAIVFYLTNGNDPTAINIVADNNNPDLLSLAVTLGADFVGALTGQVVKLRKGGVI